MLCSSCAENSDSPSESELPSISNRRHSLLKRPTDLPEEDGDRRKKIALTTLGEKTIEVQATQLETQVELNGEETREGSLALNSTDEKGKGKAKCSKRKT